MSEIILDHNDKSIPSYLSALEERDSCFLLRFKGVVNMETIAKNKPKMDQMIKKHNLLSKHIFCDLSGATGSDTATLAAIISRLVELGKMGKKIVFFGMDEHLKNIVEISKLDDCLVSCETEEEALKLVGAGQKRT